MEVQWILAFISASKLLLDLHYLFHHSFVFISGFKKKLLFCSVDREKTSIKYYLC